MINGNKLSLALGAYAEKHGKVKLNDLDTFFIIHHDETGNGISYWQVIVNKGGRIIKYDNQSSNNRLILVQIPNPAYKIKTVKVVKTTTTVIDGISGVTQEEKDYALNEVITEQVKQFANQFLITQTLDHHSYMFALEIPKGLEKVEIINNIGNVYFTLDGQTPFGNCITNSYYDKEKNLIYTNLYHFNKNILSNTVGNLRAQERRQVYSNEQADKAKKCLVDLSSLLNTTDLDNIKFKDSDAVVIQNIFNQIHSILK